MDPGKPVHPIFGFKVLAKYGIPIWSVIYLIQQQYGKEKRNIINSRQGFSLFDPLRMWSDCYTGQIMFNV